MELREDGAYLIRLDKVRLKEDMAAVFDKLRPVLEDMLVQALGEGLARAGVAGDLTTREGIETALGMPLDDVFKSVAGITMDEMIDAMTEIVSGKTDELAEVVQGRFRLDMEKNELAFSRRSEDEADPADGERFRLAGDTLEIYEPVGEPFFEDMYPVVFTREP